MLKAVFQRNARIASSSNRPKAEDVSGVDVKNVSPLFQGVYFLVNIVSQLVILPTIIFLLPFQVNLIDPIAHVTNLGIVEAIGGLAAILAAPIVGALSDRTTSSLGRRRSWMLLSTLFIALAIVLLANASALWMLILGWFIVQFFANSILTMLQALIPDVVPLRQRGLISSYVGLAVSLAAILGSILVAVVLKNNKLSAYYVFLLALVIGVVLFSLIFKDRPLAKSEVALFRVRPFLAKFWISPRKYPDFSWALGTRFLLFLGYFAFATYLQYYLKDGLHYDRLFPGKTVDQAVLSFQSIEVVALIVFSFVAGIISDRLQRRKPVVMASAILVALGLLTPVILPSWTGVQICAAILGAGYGGFFAVDTALATQVLPSVNDRARDLGIIGLALSVPQLLSPILAATLLTTFHTYTVLFIVAALLSALSGIFVHRIKGVR